MSTRTKLLRRILARYHRRGVAVLKWRINKRGDVIVETATHIEYHYGK